MTPSDPFSEPRFGIEPTIESSAARPRSPFWDYVDLGFLVSLCVPALFIAALLVRAFSRFLHYGKPFEGLLIQLVWYALVFGSLFGLLRVRYDRPFWRSLGWTVSVTATTASFFAGPILAVSVGYLGYVLHTPDIKLPFEQMFQNQPTLILFGIFVVILGPLCEELAFRGFLMPLLMRSFGVVAGIIATGLLFGSLHAYEYSWSWRHVVLIGTAGTVFGWVRYKTNSTAASTLMHATYNLTQFAAFLIQSHAR
jgi:membrane protease YdiL (CAAX protease family)